MVPTCDVYLRGGNFHVRTLYWGVVWINQMASTFFLAAEIVGALIS